jgi:lysophospholipase L1-like esterase
MVSLYAVPVRSAEVAVKDGEKIAFMGDSITAGGWDSVVGYIKLVVNGLESAGVKATPIPAGVGGHKSNNMLSRLDHDVLAKKPEWMTLSCGVNDVWHGARGVPLDKYKENITAIVDKCKAAGTKVMILTSTVIGEEAVNDNNKKLADYNDFLRSLAKEKGCLLADLNADMQEYFKKAEAAGRQRGRLLTADGVHMNAEGNVVMALGVLRAFGLSDEQLNKAQEGWLDIPSGTTISVTIRQSRKLEALAAKEKKPVEGVLDSLLPKNVEK